MSTAKNMSVDSVNKCCSCSLSLFDALRGVMVRGGYSTVKVPLVASVGNSPSNNRPPC